MILLFKLLNRFSKNDMDLLSQIKSMFGKDFLFKLKLSNYNLKEGLENYKVSKVYQPDEKLELQCRSNKGKM